MPIRFSTIAVFATGALGIAAHGESRRGTDVGSGRAGESAAPGLFRRSAPAYRQLLRRRVGRRANTPRDAYRYAQGPPVTYLGHEVRRNAPLDFLAVSDHAEYMGVSPRILDKRPPSKTRTGSSS